MPRNVKVGLNLTTSKEKKYIHEYLLQVGFECILYLTIVCLTNSNPSNSYYISKSMDWEVTKYSSGRFPTNNTNISTCGTAAVAPRFMASRNLGFDCYKVLRGLGDGWSFPGEQAGPWNEERGYCLSGSTGGTRAKEPPGGGGSRNPDGWKWAVGAGGWGGERGGG